MFGTYRTILAMLVVALHLGGAWLIGVYAVFGFYCLSGYLMTLIMQTSYGYTLSGFKKYTTNRFLRIFPIYWVSITLSIFLVIWLGADWTTNYHPAIFIPSTYWDAFRNVALFFPFRDIPRLTPPAWALTVELFFYLLIGLGLSKSKRVTVAWFVASLLFHIIALATGLGWEQRYFSIAAASLPFSTGALIWHFGGSFAESLADVQQRWKNFLPLIGLIALFANWIFGILLWKLGGVDLTKTLFFYSNYVICSVMVVILMRRRNLPFISRSLDNFLGNWSYPIYLIHYQAGVLAIVAFSMMGLSLSRPSPLLFFATIPILLLLSHAATVLLERPIEALREKVKGVAS